MCRCKECRFCNIGRNGHKWIVWCMATDEIIEYETAMDNDLECDLYVAKLDADNSEA